MESANQSAGSAKPTVLVIDDEPSLLRYFEYNIRSLGFEVRMGGSVADLFRLLAENDVAVVLLDLMLPDGEALDYLPSVLQSHPNLSVILISAHGTIPKAVAAIRQGAVNFVQKPVSPEQLENVVRQAVEIWRLKREVRQLKRRLDPITEFHGMVGQSEPMQRVYDLIESVAATSVPVMITGESGTGKELVARAIHELSARAPRPFIPINCAAIPRDLLESEIFGHEKGAFTGAIEQYRGCFERADKGTLLLDEICEMDIGLQAKLLRLIQEQKFFRIGGSTQIQVNVRILASTNRDPLKMIEAGKFREDLFHRLDVLPIHLPPLRERREDIASIASRYLVKAATQNHKRFQRFDLEALAALEDQPWSGNVRELQNVIEQVVVLHDAETVTLRMLPQRIQSRSQTAVRGPVPVAITGRPLIGDETDPDFSVTAQSRIRPFWQIERDEIQRALDLCNGNVQDVARRLEISPATLYRKIEKYGLVK